MRAGSGCDCRVGGKLIALRFPTARMGPCTTAMRRPSCTELERTMLLCLVGAPKIYFTVLGLTARFD